MLVAVSRQLTACSMAAGELSLRPCLPLSRSSWARSLLFVAGGESRPVGVVAPGEVITEEGEAMAVAVVVVLPPGEAQGWEVDVGEAVLLLLLSLLRKSCIQCRVASTAAPTVKAMTVVSDKLCGDILQRYLSVSNCRVFDNGIA